MTRMKKASRAKMIKPKMKKVWKYRVSFWFYSDAKKKEINKRWFKGTIEHKLGEAARDVRVS